MIHLVTSEYWPETPEAISASVYHEGDCIVIQWDNGAELEVNLKTGDYGYWGPGDHI